MRTAAWTKVTPVGGGGPAALEGSAMCSVGHTLYVFGGTDAGFTPSDKLFTYDTQLGFWAEMAQVSRPAARSYHTLTRVGDALFLFGGSDDESSPLDDLHPLALVSLGWTAVAVPYWEWNNLARGGPRVAYLRQRTSRALAGELVEYSKGYNDSGR